MRKIAFFVEGQTEQIFLNKFLQEYLGKIRYTCTHFKQFENQVIHLKYTKEDDNSKFFITILDVAGDKDEKVTSWMLEFADNYINDMGNEYIIGLHDLYPKPRDKKNEFLRLKNIVFANECSEGLADKLKLFLAIMETEAWFLYDDELFAKIHSRLTVEYIKTQLLIDLKNTNPEEYDHPTEIMCSVYQLINRNYTKSEKQVSKICNNIDYAKYVNPTNMDSWNLFFSFVEQVFE